MEEPRGQQLVDAETLRQTHQREVADPYTNTGSLYLTSVFLLPLGLPPTDSFWTCPDADWTAKKAWGGEPFQKDGRSRMNPQPLYWE